MLVFVQTILPYAYTRSIAEIKKNNSRREPKEEGTLNSVQQFIKANVSMIQDFFMKNVRPVHLAIFYFFGAYYNFSKRFTGIRYVSNGIEEKGCALKCIIDFHSPVGP